MAKLDTNATAVQPDGWASVLDKLLVGVTHNISNRVATLAGVSDILSGDATVPPILRALSDEVPRLEEAIRLLRLLAAPDGEDEEALEATRVADDAISLAQLHPACRNVAFEIERREAVPPVVARPVALTHAMVVALAAAASEIGAPATVEERTGGAAVPLRVPIVFLSDESDLVMSVGSSVVRARLLSARRD
jgi:hypothetical protein